MTENEWPVEAVQKIEELEEECLACRDSRDRWLEVARDKHTENAELEEALRPFAELGPAFCESETLVGQILVIVRRVDVEKANAALSKNAPSEEDEDDR